MKHINVFVAGAKSLSQERTILKALANDMNSESISKESNTHVSILSYENFGDCQKEYDDYIIHSANIVVFVLDGYIGKKTQEEYILAVNIAKNKKRGLKVIVFLKDFKYKTPQIQEIENLVNKNSQDYYVTYKNHEDLLYKTKARIEKNFKEIEPSKNIILLRRILRLALICFAFSTMGIVITVRTMINRKHILIAGIEERYKKFGVKIKEDISNKQIEVIDKMLGNMIEIIPDSLWMCKYECTISEWAVITCDNYDEMLGDYPKTMVSYGDCEQIFLESLRELTGIAGTELCLPNKDDWQFAANGGVYNDNTIYSGDSIIDNVACYKKNSNGTPHKCNGQTTDANHLGLYDMSGNVSEWVTGFEKTQLMSVCGGHYNSPPEDVQIKSCNYVNPNTRSTTIGFRIAIKKNAYE